MSPARVRPWWPAAVLAVLCLGGWALGGPEGEPAPNREPTWFKVPDEIWAIARAEREAPRQPAKPTAAAIAMLKGSSVGDTVLEDWTVARMQGPDDDGAFAFGLRRDEGGTFTVRVTPIDARPYRPPLRTDSYDYFYDSIAPDVGIDDAAAVEVLQDLAHLIEGD